MVTQNHMMMYNHGMKNVSVCVAAALIPISSSTLMDTPWHSWDSPSMQPAETWWTNRQARSWSRPSWIDNSTRPSSSTESPSWRTLMPCLGRYLMMVMWLQINNSANTSACPDMNCLVEWVLDSSCLPHPQAGFVAVVFPGNFWHPANISTWWWWCHHEMAALPSPWPQEGSTWESQSCKVSALTLESQS